MHLLLLLSCATESIEDGVTLGPFTQVKTSFTSAFVAVTDQGVLLVDAGYQDDGKNVEAHLEPLGLTLRDVDDVLLTHGHSDHTAGLPAYENATVWAHEDEVALILEEGPEGIQVDQRFVDGETLDIQGFTIQPIRVPGHTDGNVVYLVDGVLLMGDTAMLYSDGTVGPPPEKYSSDPAQAQSELLLLRDSLQTRQEEISAIGFSHSAALRGDLSAFWEMEARPE
ncbi:MAG: MBL fold metallo-hydrolase [Myxococcota bacterium]|nr:MBL fold metallo-hydrolase [Myxococcota bacterium]